MQCHCYVGPVNLARVRVRVRVRVRCGPMWSDAVISHTPPMHLNFNTILFVMAFTFCHESWQNGICSF